ncbi:hypothetical protein P167DRAFT_538420 [Morchella conica CCBAS932]|uniref:Uncharacterized protein n=1 Tax=Morchella conica CCBAS932 TaxID=1392247 RepID=A0A3N4KGB5_9PEZI|nr:hypothetical protein P167DRAFT_538420 [Morchella conica CCBAS932]
MSSSRPDSNSQQIHAEYLLANPAPGTFFKRHLPNRRLLLQLQKATVATDGTRGRLVPAYDVRCGGSFVRRLAGCFSNVTAKDILIVATGDGEEEDLVQKSEILASIRRVPAKEPETPEKLLVKFFDEVTWNCERLPSGTFQFTPASGEDPNIQASWEPEPGASKGYTFSVTTVSPAATPRSPTPKSPKSPVKPRNVLARMDAENIQVFGVRSAPKGSFLGKKFKFSPSALQPPGLSSERAPKWLLLI